MNEMAGVSVTGIKDLKDIKEYLDWLKTAEHVSETAEQDYEADPENMEKEAAFDQAYKEEFRAFLAAAEALVKITDGAIDMQTAKSLIKNQRAEMEQLLTNTTKTESQQKQARYARMGKGR